MKDICDYYTIRAHQLNEKIWGLLFEGKKSLDIAEIIVENSVRGSSKIDEKKMNIKKGIHLAI